jgi:hypothetical protein
VKEIHVKRVQTLLYLALLSQLPCFAQLDRASLSGTITDSSGAIIPEATVTAVQSSTQASFNTVTNGSGAFNFAGLPVGEYTVSVTKQGFTQGIAQGIVLTSNAAVRADMILTPGNITEKVEVQAQSTLIEQRSSAYGADLQTKSLENLPLQVDGGKRSLYGYLATIPGVSNAGFQNNIMGGVGMYSQIVIDGAPAEYNAAVGGVAQRPPSVEDIGEFKVVNSVSAEYGLTGGAFMSFTTKSGTNDFHGDAYEYFRNNVLDARSFFAQDVAIQRQNEFGFTAGGPVVIPHVYNGRNKTFIFGNFTQFIQHNGSSGVVLTLPTQAFRQGDFSALLGSAVGTDAAGNQVVSGAIYDPHSTRSNGQNGFVRSPYPNNMIPTSQLSVVSQNWQSRLPLPTLPGVSNNFVGSSPSGINDEDSYFLKIDQMLGTSRLSGSYKLARSNSVTPCVLPPIYCGSLGTNFAPSGRIAFNSSIKPNIVNDFSAGLDRASLPGEPNAEQAVGATTIGLKNTFYPCSPQLNIPGYPGEPYFGTHVCKQAEADTNWKYIDSVSIFAGKHNIKFGVNYLRWAANFPTFNQSNGLFGFSPLETGQPGFQQTGYSYASFLLGLVDSSTIQAPQETGQREWALGFYVQDEFRVTPKLTLNYGLRYDYQPQLVEPHDDISEFDPTVPNPGAGNLLGAMTFLGTGPGRLGKRRYGDTWPWGFGPRFGFAYQLSSRTVLRGSYGLFNGPVSQNQWAQVQQHYGFNPQFTVASQDQGITAAFNWDNGFPIGGFNTNPTIDPTVSNNSGTSFVGRNSARPPQVQMTNISIQHQLPGDIVLEVAYLNNLGHHISTTSAESINQLDFNRYGSLGSLLTQSVYSPAAVAAGIPVPYAGFQGSVAQALRPFPQYQGINGISSPIGNSAYHAGQAKLQKRFSGGLTFLVGYTLAKTLTDIDSTPGYFAAGPQNADNRRAERAPSSADSPQSVVGSYTYDLPFGPGKRFASGNNFLSKYILSGWSTSGILTYRQGGFLGVTTSGRLPTTGDNVALSQPTLRPDLVLGVDPRTSVGCQGFDPATDIYLNRNAFADPAPWTFGNAARVLGNVRGCPTLNEDMSLTKSIAFWDGRINLRFGADFFNVFNRVNFSNPDTNIDDPGFGRISAASPGRTGQLVVKILW